MDQACRDAGTDLATAALRASVNDPAITATIVGVSRTSRLAGLTGSLQAPLPSDLFDRLAELMSAESNWLDRPSA